MASDQTNEMEIPLHAAAKQGNAAIIKLLLEFDYKSALDEKVSLVLETFIKN